MEAGSKFIVDGKQWTAVKVTPAMVLAKRGPKGREQEHWFWKTTIEKSEAKAAAKAPAKVTPATDLELQRDLDAAELRAGTQ
jgi:hypothetical protein